MKRSREGDHKSSAKPTCSSRALARESPTLGAVGQQRQLALGVLDVHGGGEGVVVP